MDLRSSPDQALDRYWMQRCLDLARQAQGLTSPNPMVGAVVVQAHRQVGAGYHPGAGHPHAEVFALQQAGATAQGATLYVNLEPCNHFGRTPPCTEAILKARIRRVVAGMVDPNPQVAGTGLERLRAAGVETTVGVEEVACRRLNEAFCFAILQGRSFGILKYAMTWDGKIATRTGHSRWISGEESRRQVHQLRAVVDAVVVGAGTVIEDDPQLTARSVEAKRQPLRVVLSRDLSRLPTSAQIWDQTQAQTIILTGEQRDPGLQEDWQQRGVEVAVIPELSPAQVSRYLYQRGCLAVLWECGGTLAAAALESGAIQKVIAFMAPKIIGGITAPSPVEGTGIEQMSEALQLRDIQYQIVGEDLRIEGYVT